MPVPVLRFTLDDRETQTMIGRRLARVTNIRPALEDIGVELRQSTRQRFIDGRDPEGRPWKPLSTAALLGRYKGKRPLKKDGSDTKSFARYRSSRRILVGAGMRGGLMGTITYKTGPTYVDVGSVKVYAAIHQLGGKTRPHEIRARRKKALAFPGAGHPVKGVKHPGSTIPARPFLGVSDADRAAIRRILLRHLGGEGRR